MKIETDRLIIRGFEPSDAADLHEILGDSETMEFCEPPYDFDKTVQFLNDFCIGRSGALAAQLRDCGKVIGYILFNECEPGNFETGWFVNRKYWRRGYASEACRAVIDYAFSARNAEKVFAETIDTQRSVPLMKKLGMRMEDLQRGATTDLHGNPADMHVYSIRANEYEYITEILHR